MSIKKALLILLAIAVFGIVFIYLLYYFNNKAIKEEVKNQEVEQVLVSEVREKNQIKNITNDLIDNKKEIEKVRASSTLTTDSKEKIERETMEEMLKKLNSIK